MNQTAPLLTSEPPYAEAIEMWEAFWRLEDLGRPLWQIPTPPAETLFEAQLVPMLQLIQDKAFQLRASLNFLLWREALAIGDDWVPHLQPYQGVTPLASAFGCHVRYFDHTSPWVEPVIRAEDPPEKVYDLPRPSVTDGQLGAILEYTDYFVAEAGGRYPISTYLQGPMDMAYLVWDSSAFMLAMYSNPKEVHHLLRLVTDLNIAFIKELRARSPQFFACHCPPLWLPEGRGISISEDCSAVLSPKLWREFSLPYVNEMSEEFGGVVIHSCGNFQHQFDNLAQVHNLRGLNFGASETPFAAVWERFGGKTAILPHIGLNKEFPFESHVEFIEHIFRTADHSRGLSILVTPPTLNAEAAGTGASLGVGPHVVDDEFVGHFVQTTKETMERCIAADRQRSR
ncbi:MAG TPA: uroporphyrinogen decarboxylase family protein [Dehalococcoidia bacterium]|nr:uroporphyrinogen decarboxylase family protein [Dehalococcoidia bacterium]